MNSLFHPLVMNTNKTYSPTKPGFLVARSHSLTGASTMDIPMSPMKTNTMIKNLVKYGDGYAIEIDESLLQLIQATPDTSFEITSDGRSLILTPVRDSQREKKFEDAIAMVHKRFGNDLRRMAE